MSRGDAWSLAITLIATGIGYFVGGPIAAWVCLIAGLVIALILHFTRPKKEEEKKPETPVAVSVKDSFNPQIKQEANPSFHLHLGSEPKRLPPLPVPKPKEKESNLVLNKKLSIGPLYLIGDIWSKTVQEDARNPEQYRYQAIYAEVKNSGKPDEEVGPVHDIKAELVIDDEELTPLPWIDQHFNRANFQFGDVKFVVLAVVLPYSRDVMDWRVPINHRDYDLAPGVPSMNFDHVLKRFVEKSDVKLKLLHVQSGKILKTFEGTYRWKDGESMPTFRFI
jgi:hypothetical protein